MARQIARTNKLNPIVKYSYLDIVLDAEVPVGDCIRNGFLNCVRGVSILRSESRSSQHRRTFLQPVHQVVVSFIDLPNRRPLDS